VGKGGVYSTLVLAFILGFGTLASATNDYYVSLTGSNVTGNGSHSYPWRTISYADAHVSLGLYGTVVHVAPGVYFGNVTTARSGTESARLRFVSDIKWGAKIVGSGGNYAKVWAANGSYVDIDGFDVSGTTSMGIYTNGTSDHVLNNHVHDLTSCGASGSGGAGIDVGNYYGSGGWVIGNVVHDIAIRYNAPGTCSPGSHGIYLSQKYAVAENNIVYRVQTYGIHEYHAATNTIISNNLVFACGGQYKGGGIVIAAHSPFGLPNNHTTVINNVVRNNPAWGIIEGWCSPYCGPQNIYANNVVYQNGVNLYITGGTPGSNVHGNLGTNPQMVHFNANPGTPSIVDGLVAFPYGSFHSTSSSPSVNRGTTQCAGGGLAPCVNTFDLDNVARPQGTAIDIGNYEYH
jgi:hypothetical protein